MENQVSNRPNCWKEISGYFDSINQSVNSMRKSLKNIRKDTQRKITAYTIELTNPLPN